MRVLLLAGVVVIARLVGCGGAAPAAHGSYAGSARSCPRPSTYAPTLTPARGAPASTVAIRGTLPLYNEAGKLDLAHAVTRIDVWWNVDFAHAFSAVGANPQHPIPARRGPALHLLRAAMPKPEPCTYRLQVVLPRIGRDRYPITLLYSSGSSTAVLPTVWFTIAR